MSVPVDDLLMSKRTNPPAFQKYLAWSALGNVTVCVQTMVQAAPPDPVAVVLAIDPVQVELVVPDAAALPRLVVTLLISVCTLAKMPITFPVTGAVLDVNVVLVWVPDVAKLLTNVAQLVAVTTPLADTDVIAVCPQPLSPEPVDQMSFRPPAVVVKAL